jgi:hypothetical protein
MRWQRTTGAPPRGDLSEQNCELSRQVQRKDETLALLAQTMASYGEHHLAKVQDPSITYEKAVETVKRAQENCRLALTALDALRA